MKHDYNNQNENFTDQKFEQIMEFQRLKGWYWCIQFGVSSHVNNYEETS